MLNNKTYVLHIAAENTAGVPINFVKMQQQSGLESRLLTFYKLPYGFEEDVCLDILHPRNRLAMFWRRFKQKELRKNLENKKGSLPKAHYFKPMNTLEKAYMNFRSFKNKNKYYKTLRNLNAELADIIHYDGGIDFYIDSRSATEFKKEGKKIVNCYYGDDLRTRGIIRKMEEISDLNLTFEYDHILRYPNIKFLFFPFRVDLVEYIPDEEYLKKMDKIRIVHAPTDRYVKGTDTIIKAIDVLKTSGRIEFVLLENLPHHEVLKIKSTCHISIDQIGNRGGTGYGLNSLESLSIGLPTITDMAWDFDKWLPENPFIVADENNLKEKLSELIDNKDKLLKKRGEGRQWVEKYHSPSEINKILLKYYSEAGII